LAIVLGVTIPNGVAVFIFTFMMAMTSIRYGLAGSAAPTLLVLTEAMRNGSPVLGLA
jgi:hypothetical protein